MVPEAELNADRAPATLLTLLATPPLAGPLLPLLAAAGSSFRVMVDGNISSTASRS